MHTMGIFSQQQEMRGTLVARGQPRSPSRSSDSSDEARVPGMLPGNAVAESLDTPGVYSNPQGVYSNPPGVYSNPQGVYSNPQGVYSNPHAAVGMPMTPTAASAPIAHVSYQQQQPQCMLPSYEQQHHHQQVRGPMASNQVAPEPLPAGRGKSEADGKEVLPVPAFSSSETKMVQLPPDCECKFMLKKDGETIKFVVEATKGDFKWTSLIVSGPAQMVTLFPYTDFIEDRKQKLKKRGEEKAKESQKESSKKKGWLSKCFGSE